MTSVCYKNEWRGGVEKPVISIIGRDENNKRRIITEDKFVPYVYIPYGDLHVVQEHCSEWIVNISHGYKAYIGSEKLVKIGVKKPKNVKDIRNFLKKVGGTAHEGDVLFPDRFIIDKGIYSGVKRDRYGNYTLYDDMIPNLRVCALDVETMTPRSDRKSGIQTDKPITCITLWDSYDETFTFMYWYKEKIDVPDEVAKHVQLVEHYYTERSMLNAVRSWLIRYKPDVIAGYNVKFDIRQLVERMRINKLRVNSISPIGSVSVFKDKIDIKGIEIFDIYKAYRTLKTKELLRYTLEYIMEVENISVSKIQIWDFYEAWMNEPLTVMERNMIDVVGMVELMQKLEIVEYFDEIRRQVGCRLSDATIRSRVVDILLLREAHARGVILPTKKEDPIVLKTPGGFVREVTPDIYDNVAYIDLTAMYPTAIIKNNMSPETFVAAKEESPDIHYIMPGIGFWKTPEGILPTIIKRLMVLRDAKKGLMTEHHFDTKEFKKLFKEQESLKYQINSAYGMTKFKGSRIKSDVVMLAIAFMARMVLRFISNIAEQTHEVIYEDTDSVWVQLATEVPEEEAHTLVRKMNELSTEFTYEINTDPNFLFTHDGSSQYEVKVEYLAKRLIIVARKKYALETVEGERVQKGIGTVRSDTSEKGREMLLHCMELALGYNEQDIPDYVRTEIAKIRAGKVDAQQLAIPKRWAKKEYADRTPIHVRAGLYSNTHLGTDFQFGDKVAYLKIKHVGKLPRHHKHAWKNRDEMWEVNAIAIQERTIIPPDIAINYDAIVDDNMRGLLNALLLMIGESWEGMSHATLEKWF